MNLTVFLFGLFEDKNLTIFLLSLAFLLVVIIIWVIVILIFKKIKEDKHYQNIARQELESLGIELDSNIKDDSNEPIIIDLSEPKNDDLVIEDEEDDTDKEDEVYQDDSSEYDVVIEDEEESFEIVAKVEENDINEEDNSIVSEEKDDDNEELLENINVDTESNDEVSNEEEESQEDIEAVAVDNNEIIKENTEVAESEEINEDQPIEKPIKKGRTYNGKYEIFQVADGFQYHLKASNGEILVTSETYRSREGVLKAIDAVKRNLENGEVRIFADKRGKYKFKLVSRNYRVLAISSNYSVEKSAVRAAESFKKFAVKADIVDIELVDKDAKTATIIEIITTEDKPDGRFVIEKFDGEYSWDLKASNGQILCQAEGYTSKAGCLYSIDTFKRNVELGVFKCIKDKTGRYCYKLYAPNGRVCAIGESYNTKSGAESAANSVVSYFKLAEIVEVKS